jgi:hypothetical protein
LEINWKSMDGNYEDIPMKKTTIGNHDGNDENNYG